jgi:hypothetical protein
MTWGHPLANKSFWLLSRLCTGVDKRCLPRCGVSLPGPIVVRVAMGPLTTLPAFDGARVWRCRGLRRFVGTRPRERVPSRGWLSRVGPKAHSGGLCVAQAS